MKIYINQKIGYIAGVHGCSAEVFQLIAINGEEVKSTLYHGLYGANHRIAEIMKQKGYSEQWATNNYGKMKWKDIKHINSETKAIEEIKKEF